MLQKPSKELRRLCFFSHSAMLGGAERVLLDSVTTLQNAGMACCVILPGKGPLAEELLQRGIPFWSLPMGRWIGLASEPLSARIDHFCRMAVSLFPAVWLCARWRADLILTNSAVICIGALVAKILGVPHIWHLHEVIPKSGHGFDCFFGERFSFWAMDRLSSQFILPSRTAAKSYSKVLSASKTHVMFCPLTQRNSSQSTLAAAHTPDENLRCIIVGTLLETKRQEDAIKAIGLVAESGIKLHLVVVGGGDDDYKQRLRDLVHQEGIGSQVTFTGPVADARDLIETAEIVLVCSLGESFGRVTAEGMLAGKVVVGANSGATPELIDDGINGLLYVPGSPDDLASKLMFLYRNPEIRLNLGIAAKRFAQERFHLEAYQRGLLDLVNRSVSQL